MGRYGQNKTLLDAGASVNAYTSVNFVNTGFAKLKIVITNNHASAVIKYKVECRAKANGALITEVAETTLAGNTSVELNVDALFYEYIISYASNVANTPSNDIDIDYIGRVGAV